MSQEIEDGRVQAVLDLLASHASADIRRAMDERYGIHTDQAFGVAMGDMKRVAKPLGRDHDLAEALWQSGWYEARIVASMVDDAALVTVAQMDRWCRDFDNWAICDTVCFNLFDRAPDAWSRVEAWAGEPAEFVKRGAFALLWTLARHDREASDDAFLAGLALVEREAADERPLVKKSLSMALRSVGKRNTALHAAALATASRLVASPSASARWIGKTAIRDLQR